MRTALALLLFGPLCVLGALLWLCMLLAALLECSGVLLRRGADRGADWLSGVTL